MSESPGVDGFSFMDEQGDLEGAAVGLATMARDLLAQKTVQGTLDRIVEHAVDLVDGCEHSGILLLHEHRRVETAAATSDLVRRSDETQGELGEGPCFDAAFHEQEVYRVADMETTVSRWPRYAPRARELGVGSMMGFLLFTDEGDLGALDLYSSQPDTFGRHSELVGWLLASHAAVAFSAARSHAQLRTATSTREVIGEAVGITMERAKLTESQAFERLAESARTHDVGLRELAERINRNGEPPQPQ